MRQNDTKQNVFLLLSFFIKKHKYEISDAVLQSFSPKNVASHSFKRQWNDGIVSEDIKWRFSSKKIKEKHQKTSKDVNNAFYSLKEVSNKSLFFLQMFKVRFL